MDDDTQYTFTEKGLRVLFDVVDRFRAGEAVEEIAASHGMDVTHLQVMMVMGTLLGVIE